MRKKKKNEDERFPYWIGGWQWKETTVEEKMESKRRQMWKRRTKEVFLSSRDEPVTNL